uniref:RNA helicase n=1 Tax=Strongyloides stercoralis TaxID=6248 RepID=A0A0K0EC50_STRER
MLSSFWHTISNNSNNTPDTIPNEGKTLTDLTEDDKYLKDENEIKEIIFNNITITRENSKRYLNEILQKRGMSAVDYDVSTKTNKYNIRFFATGKIKFLNSNQIFEANGMGNSKKEATNDCSFKLLHKILSSENLSKSFREVNEQGIIDIGEVVSIEKDEKLIKDIETYLRIKQIILPELPKYNPKIKISLTSHIILNKHKQDSVKNCIVDQWSLPFAGFNCWNSSVININSIYANKTLDELSTYIGREESLKIPLPIIENARKSLPIYKHKDKIIEKCLKYQVVLIKSSTGSGKSTQVAQYLLSYYINEGRGAEFNCYITQPRRFSAISLAERVSKERYEDIGLSVGYSVRFDSRLPRPFGAICFCTVGTLLKRMEGGLFGVSHIIIDEVHERELNTDFLLIILRELSYKFPNLKIILMSATVDTTLFSNYFYNLEIVSIDDKGYNVEHYFLQDIVQALKYMPEKFEFPHNIKQDNTFWNWNNINPTTGLSPISKIITEHVLENEEIPYEIIKKLIETCAKKEERGSVLVFMPGWNEIQHLIKYLKESKQNTNGLKYHILPLHSLLPIEEQRLVFETPPDGYIKIIVSTNIAESSITVNDVLYVIDTCRVRKKMYTKRYNMSEFVQMWTSKACIYQRRGRVGRVRDGFCFHLCSQEQFDQLPEYSMPEILISPLHSTILAVKVLGLGNSVDFIMKALEPPNKDSIINDEIYLQTICALDEFKELTSLGRKLAQLPISPIMGKTILMSAIFDLVDPMTMIVSHAELQKDIFHLASNNIMLKNSYDKLLGDWQSDHLLPLFIHNYIKKNTKQAFSMQVLCQYININHSTYKMMLSLYTQLTKILQSKCKIPCLNEIINMDNSKKNVRSHVILSLLVGAYYPNIAFMKKKKKFISIDRSSIIPHKYSSIFNKSYLSFSSSPFCVYSEKVMSIFPQCKEISVISPLQLLLFGCKDVLICGENEILLDNHIKIRMDPKFAQLILAIRPCVDELLISVCEKPHMLSYLDFNRYCVKNIVERISTLGYKTNECNDINLLMKYQTNISFPDVETILEQQNFVNGDFYNDIINDDLKVLNNEHNSEKLVQNRYNELINLEHQTTLTNDLCLKSSKIQLYKVNSNPSNIVDNVNRKRKIIENSSSYNDKMFSMIHDYSDNSPIYNKIKNNDLSISNVKILPQLQQNKLLKNNAAKELSKHNFTIPELPMSKNNIDIQNSEVINDNTEKIHYSGFSCKQNL